MKYDKKEDAGEESKSFGTFVMKIEKKLEVQESTDYSTPEKADKLLNRIFIDQQ